MDPNYTTILITGTPKMVPLILGNPKPYNPIDPPISPFKGTPNFGKPPYREGSWISGFRLKEVARDCRAGLLSSMYGQEWRLFSTQDDDA